LLVHGEGHHGQRQMHDLIGGTLVVVQVRSEPEGRIWPALPVRDAGGFGGCEQSPGVGIVEGFVILRGAVIDTRREGPVRIGLGILVVRDADGVLFALGPVDAFLSGYIGVVAYVGRSVVTIPDIVAGIEFEPPCPLSIDVCGDGPVNLVVVFKVIAAIGEVHSPCALNPETGRNQSIHSLLLCVRNQAERQEDG